MRSRFLTAVAIVLLAALAGESEARTLPVTPPVLPLPVSAGSWRGAMLGLRSPLRVAAQSAAPADDTQQTVLLPLSAGLSMISIPLRTDSQLLSDLLPNLPPGSRVWTWDTENQEFVEGFDQQLPAGQGALLYLPVPAVISVTGQINRASDTSVELANGWNLVGLPYTNTVSRASLTVYAAQVQTAFNDAVDQGDLSEPIMTLGTNGYEEVGADDSLEPMRAYWVYSNDADLIDFPPGLLQSAAKEFGWWVAKQAGAAGFSYGANYLIAYMSPDPDAATQAKLDGIISQLNTLEATMANVNSKLTDIKNAISGLSNKLDTVERQLEIAPARTAVKTYYDDKNGTNQSYTWFENQVRAKQSVPDASRIKFANEILGQFQIRAQFFAIYGAIVPNDPTVAGVFEALSPQLMPPGASGDDLARGYRAFEAYFNDLLTLQVKLMTLYTSATNTLAAVPGSGYTTADGEAWRTGTYWPIIVEEANRFRRVAEAAVVSSVRISATASDPPVSFHSQVNDIILPSLDFGMMQLLNEKQGMRVRALVSPFFNGNTVSVVDFGSQPELQPPPPKTTVAGPLSDNTGWTTMTGPKTYDYWAIDSNKTPHLYFGRNWLMYSTVLSDPPYRRVGRWNVKVVDAFGITEDGDASKYPLQKSGLYYVDDKGTPNVQGASIKFGTVMVAKRTSARSLLRMPKNVVKNSSPCGGGGTTKFGKEIDYFVIQTCVSGNAGMKGDFLFYYDQGQPTVKTTVETNLRFNTSRPRCGTSPPNVNPGSGCSYGEVALYTPSNTRVSFLQLASNESKAQSDSVTWTPGVWNLQMYLLLAASNKEIAQVWKGPIVIKPEN